MPASFVSHASPSNVVKTTTKAADSFIPVTESVRTLIQTCALQNKGHRKNLVCGEAWALACQDFATDLKIVHFFEAFINTERRNISTEKFASLF